MRKQIIQTKSCVLEETSYTEKVDDITTMGDGSVLLLQRQPCYIKRLLGNRILNFAHPGSNTPQCIHAISENNMILLCGVNRFVFGGNKHDQKRTREVIMLDYNCVVQFRFDFQYDKFCIPIEIIVKNTSDMYIIFQDAYYAQPVSNIVRIDLKTKTLDEDNVFHGAIGMEVSYQFICNGLCFDPSFKIIVADKNHHSILSIENMKYLKHVFLAQHGLDSPGALAYFNGILWIADGNKIHKLKYK